MQLDGDSCSVSYQNDTSHSYMVIKLKPGERLIDYQIKIIKDNPAQNLLTLHRKQFDNEIFIYYEITSKITMEQLLTRRKLNRFEFLTIIKSLIKGLQTGKRYLLHGGRYILDLKYIYINPSTLEAALAYMPIETPADIKEEVRTFLIDLIVYKTSFTNPEDGSFVYRLLNLLKSDAFSLEQLDKLVFSIAVDSVETKPEGLDNFQVRELTSKNSNKSTNGRGEKVEGGRLGLISILHHRKLYALLLTQLLFIASALLILRLLVMQALVIDHYSLAGGILLFLTADFLVVKKLSILDKREVIGLKNEEAINNAKSPESSERKRTRNSRGQIRDQSYADKQRPNVFSDEETTILSEQAAPYAYLVSCLNEMNERIILNKASFIIGRVRNQVDYVSRNNAIGKVHAEIISRENMHYIIDLNSRNGTYINGERIISNVEYAIKNNDTIAFANSEYKFMWTDRASQLQGKGL